MIPAPSACAAVPTCERFPGTGAHGQAVEGVATQRGRHGNLLKEVARRSVVLAVVVGPLLAACWWVTEQRPLGGLTLGVYVAAAGLLILCERWLAFDGAWGSALRGSRTDFFYVGIATLMDKAIFLLCVTAVASVGRDLASHFRLALWPNHWNLGLQVLAALLIADAAAYFRHRLFHRSSVLWRFHRIHHSMTELYWIRSAYTHPLEQLAILMAIMLPIALLGAGDEVVAAVAFLFGLSGLLQHANVDSRSSVLNYVFATPEVHRVHHVARQPESHSNFSAFLVWMDLLFRTYRRPAPAAAPVRVGLEGVTAFPKDFLSHLAMPFRSEPTGLDADGAWERGPHEARAANEL
jgi:sterol desaturase/sphingolipid hydroxylase (fatty acid hydroxylase superfamily)